MCAQGYACDNGTGTGLPSGDEEALEYFAHNLTSFDCIVTSESTDHGPGLLQDVDYLSTPTLKTGYGAYAPIPEKEKKL